jgi:hypothetical protein
MGLCDETSAATTTEIINDTLNKNVFSFLNKTVTVQSTGAVSDQKMTVSKIRYKNCVLNISQTADIKVTALQQFSSQNALDLQAMITNVLTNNVASEANATSGFMSQPVSAETNTKVTNAVKNVVEKKLTLDTLNQMITSIEAKMDMKVEDVVYDQCGYLSIYKELGMAPPMEAIKRCDVTKPCNISQDLKITMLAQQIVNTTVSAISKDTQLSDIKNDIKSTASATASGPLEGLGNMIKGIFSGQSGVICSILSIILLCIAGFVAYMRMGGGKQAAAEAIKNNIANNIPNGR